MNIKITKNNEEFYRLSAWVIVNQILTKPNSVIGLSTGRTTGGIHNAVAEIYKAHPFDTSKVIIFNLDEVTNVSRDYFGSCYYMILNEFIKPLNIPVENFIMPPSISDDWKTECQKFEAAISAKGDVDLQVLGIGENGHIGFNQPGTPFSQTTFTSFMDERLEKRIRSETDSPDSVKLGGITYGIKNVMASKKILLVANTYAKKDILNKALNGPITT
ncbi:MAG: galactosamine-6-phosphate isomerase, partial [Clostridia bacterium]|nr:galactosamine-6-phosphate isomerase [Clostridia bacterium]